MKIALKTYLFYLSSIFLMLPSIKGPPLMPVRGGKEEWQHSSESSQNSKPPISPVGNSTCALRKKMTNCADTTMASAKVADPPLS